MSSNRRSTDNNRTLDFVVPPPPALPSKDLPTAAATPVGGDEVSSAFDPVVSSKQRAQEA